MKSRRELLVAGVQAGVVGLVARMGLAGSALERGTSQSDYGPISPLASLNTGETILALPAGFQYTVFGKTGTTMSDGRSTPGSHDGMAAFANGSNVRLVRNHEVGGVVGAPIGPVAEAYDPKAGGGTTTLDVHPTTRLPVRSFVSLGGTVRNCAGGPTPWGSWITCEETFVGPADGYDKRHGYCFEVPAGPVPRVNQGAEIAAVRPSEPLRAMGRFWHEAVAVDPATGIVYLTEDRGTAGFYRFVPSVRGRLHLGGTLQMLRVVGSPNADLRTGQTVGEAMGVEWVTITDPDPQGTNALAVFQEGRAQGGAMFARLEGCWQGSGKIYLDATSGGNAGLGQVWVYEPAPNGGILSLLFESASANVMEKPDNMCVSPRGGLVVCEDGDGSNYVRGLMPTGPVFDFARNVLNGSEFAGSCFSPDGQTLFVNIQSPGMTLAIWGPWTNGPL